VLLSTEMEDEKHSLVSTKNLDRRFGQSPVFVASTLLLNGGVHPSTNPGSTLKEAIHVISCGFEDKTEWGKEVSETHVAIQITIHILSLVHRGCNRVLHLAQWVPTVVSDVILYPVAGWMDIWVCHRGYFDWIQDALPWLALNLLHASPTCFQGISPYQSIRSSEPSAPVGSWFSRNFSQQALPIVVRIWRTSEMLGETGVYQHNNLSLDIFASARLLHTSSCVSADWKIHYSHCKSFLIVLLSYSFPVAICA
jgi:hypothetical protein